MNHHTSLRSRFFGLAVLFASLSGLRAQEHATFTAGNFTFTRPPKWEWVESTSQMRKAQLKATDADAKASADVVFYYFGAGGAGGVEANVNRWLGQFAEARDQINAKIEHATVGKTKITYVQAEGTYKSGMPGGPTTPNPGFALIGAILESDGGNVYIRMTGPKEFAKSLVVDFKKMVESGLKKD
ncbi:MAG TPA: hypothetical protein VK731_06155 [Candidatus Cybelea sp.]|nr:hypothetical protein [Candidatus Cybelea sp.]